MGQEARGLREERVGGERMAVSLQDECWGRETEVIKADMAVCCGCGR